MDIAEYALWSPTSSAHALRSAVELRLSVDMDQREAGEDVSEGASQTRFIYEWQDGITHIYTCRLNQYRLDDAPIRHDSVQQVQTESALLHASIQDVPSVHLGPRAPDMSKSLDTAYVPGTASTCDRESK